MHARCPGRLRGGRFWCLRPLAEALMRVRGVARAQIAQHDGEAGGGDRHAGEGRGAGHEGDELPGHLTSALAVPGGLPASCAASSCKGAGPETVWPVAARAPAIACSASGLP